jgi:hypothetical protein
MVIVFICTIGYFADGGKVHIRTRLELCTDKRRAWRETLSTRHLPEVKKSYKKKQWRPPSKKEERRKKKSKPEE